MTYSDNLVVIITPLSTLVDGLDCPRSRSRSRKPEPRKPTLKFGTMVQQPPHHRREMNGGGGGGGAVAGAGGKPGRVRITQACEGCRSKRTKVRNIVFAQHSVFSCCTAYERQVSTLTHTTSCMDTQRVSIVHIQARVVCFTVEVSSVSSIRRPITVTIY